MTYMEFERVNGGRKMPPVDEGEHPGVTRVKQMWERGEWDRIDRMAQWYEKYGETNSRAMKWFEALENLGLLGGMVTKFIIWSGIVAGGYLALTGQIAEYIRSVR